MPVESSPDAVFCGVSSKLAVRRPGNHEKLQGGREVPVQSMTQKFP
jgi:hypothetical protein